MRRGTTPTHTFTLPFDISTVKALRITYEQGGYKFVKTDYKIDGNSIQTTLTQQESLGFECNKQARIQLKVLTINNAVVISDILSFMVGECLDDEVIS